MKAFAEVSERDRVHSSAQQRRHTIQSPSLLVWHLVAGLCFLSYCFVDASSSSTSSSSNYNPYQYDQTFPQFTPDGRLLQLEYARSAADHSAPIWAVPLSLPTNGDETPSTATGEPAAQANDDFLLAIITYRSSSRVQNRLHIYETTPGNSLCVGLAGVLADGTALQRALVEENGQHERLYGTPFTTAHQWAQSASQQYRSLRNGIRPLGASACMIQVTPTATPASSTMQQSLHSTVATPELSLHITDPSGAIQTLSGAEIVKQQPTGRPYHILGGGANDGVASLTPSTLQKLDRAWRQRQQQTSPPFVVADQLALVLDTLQSNILQDNNKYDTSKRNMNQQNDDKDNTSNDDHAQEQELAWEIVLVSSTKGITKLTPRQVQAIQQRQRSADISTSRQ